MGRCLQYHVGRSLSGGAIRGIPQAAFGSYDGPGRSSVTECRGRELNPHGRYVPCPSRLSPESLQYLTVGQIRAKVTGARQGPLASLTCRGF